jgi:hypothetical protein
MIRFLSNPALAIATCSPALALASCPTADDLDGGIRVLSPDGEEEVFTRRSEHIVTAEYRYEDGEGSQSLLAQGIYIVQIVDVTGGALDTTSRLTYTYPLKPGAMPMPTPQLSWNIEALTFDSNGVGREPQIIKFGDATRLTIGKCSYAMSPIVITFPDSDDYKETLYYLPELGLSLLAEVQDQGEDPEIYQFSDIEALVK